MYETKMASLGGRRGRGDAAELVTRGFQIRFYGMLRQAEDR
jgi:hypothetical protein